MGWTILGAACMLATLGSDVGAQPAASNSTRSTQAGVYTADQAARGEEVYGNVCSGCHQTGSHTGAAFAMTWSGRPLSDLFEYISQSMPKTDPGSLTRRQNAQVVAYLLKLNGMPAGDAELPADTITLKRIRIDKAGAAPGRGNDRR